MGKYFRCDITHPNKPLSLKNAWSELKCKKVLKGVEGDIIRDKNTQK